jgi:hypothetical protein
LSDHEQTLPGVSTPAELCARLDAEMRRRLDGLPLARRRGFVSSDLAAVHAALVSVIAQDLARGPVFCDWGSGLGAVCALAASLDFEAHGIEIQAGLVHAARELVAGLGLAATFAHGSFLLPGDEDLLGDYEHVEHVPPDATRDAYRELGITRAGCDVVFAYPWPGEEQRVDRLFGRDATPGALLITYHESSRVLVQRRADDPEELQVLLWTGGAGG